MSYEGTIYSRELVRDGNDFPIKLYVFNSAMKVYSNVSDIRNDLLEILRKKSQISRDPRKYAIVFPWFEAGGRAFDIFSYKFYELWNKCNPEIESWVFKKFGSSGYWHTNDNSPANFLLPEEREIGCETGMIILGEEGKLRRSTKSLEEYINLWPDIGDLGPLVNNETS